MTKEVLVYNNEEQIFEKKKVEKISDIINNIENSSPNSVRSNGSDSYNELDERNNMDDINFQDIYIRSIDLKRHKWDLLIKIKNGLLKLLRCFRKTN
jgi:hypothetical protein